MNCFASALRRFSAGVLAVVVLAAVMAGPAMAGGKFALVIGVEKYIPEELPPLAYAEDDALALAESLEAVGFEVVTMTSQASNPLHRPGSAGQIMQQLEMHLSDRDPSDTIVVALSGHGVQFRGEDESWFCPELAVLSDRSSLVAMSPVLAAMGACGAERKLLLVDACREELQADAGGKGIAIQELDPAAPARAAPPSGTIAVYSCRAREKSYELKALGHSLFTHHVLAYLAGKAGADRYPGDELGVMQLASYVSSQTRADASRILGRSQLPEVLARNVADWPLGIRPVSPLKPGEVIENSLGMKLVVIPAGEFQMGSDETKESLRRAITKAGIDFYEDFSPTREQPVHRVTINRPFLMGQTEVTLGEFLQFYNDGYKGQLDCEKDGEGGWGYDESSEDSPFSQKPIYRPWSWGHADMDITTESGKRRSYRYPVVNVSWNDCVAFCEWLSKKEGKRYRLPTEAEWEYACRGDTTTRYWSGDDFEKLAEHDNVGDKTAKDYFENLAYHILSRDGFAFTAPVGSYRKQNPFGLFDMHGNVTEWCSDWYGKDYYSQAPAADPKGPSSGSFRVIRGGSWNFYPVYCRSANRFFGAPTFRYYRIGFRVVSDFE